jgi:hypothetical protein
MAVKLEIVDNRGPNTLEAALRALKACTRGQHSSGFCVTWWRRACLAVLAGGLRLEGQSGS